MNTVLTFSLLFFFRARYLDSRALSKLGVYIPKPDLNSFFIRDEFDGKREKNKNNILLFNILLLI